MSRILTKDGRVVVSHVVYAESLSARLCGLLGRASLPEDIGMLIRPCRSIHMWFMRFPIDAAFLDRELRVLKISRNLRPWQMAFAPRQTHCVLETAKGTLDGLQIGRVLTAET
jgi:uncharacterized membrane protein (UPF0127 family)